MRSRYLEVHQNIDGLLAARGIGCADHLHYIMFYRRKQVVYDVVVGYDGLRHCAVAADERFHRLRDHFGRGRAHLGDVAAVGRFRQIGVGHDFSDVGGLIADALHIRDHFQRGGNLPQVARDRLLMQQSASGRAASISLFLLVDFLVGGDHLLPPDEAS